ncbi:MAG: PQQ-like beta-propeller repeat protein [Bacteroidetes bacterium]|nr:PQQ-like beta-propeller repeat protein [Bacteroidota bacterium]
MKKYIGIFLLAIAPFFVFSQANQKGTMILKIKNIANQPYSYGDVCIENKATKSKVCNVADKFGKVSFEILSGNTYFVHLKTIPNIAEILVPSYGKINIIKEIVYQSSEISIDRTIKYDTLAQNIGKDANPSATEQFMTIKLTTRKKMAVTNVPVRLVCEKIHKVYLGKTDKSGEARFMVPAAQTYTLGIEQYDNFTSIQADNLGGAMTVNSYQYEQTKVDERISNDTVYQNLPVGTGPTTGRAYLHVFLSDKEKQALPDEVITFNIPGSNKVYAAKTDNQGNAYFLLPKGFKYVMNFKYEYEIDMFNIKQDFGFRTIEVESSYLGSKNIENHYAQVKRDKNGFMTEFMESKVTKRGIWKDYLEKTVNGYNIKLEKEGNASAPAIGGGKMFVSGGFYSPDFFSFDAKTGLFNWGMTLAESGASSAVYDNGIVLINTYSCTLYAIDAIAGNLLWSKWLGPIIYSTPSVSNGKVYAVYPNDIDAQGPGSENKKFALVCFDLRTGKIVWQNWLDAEAMGSPVISGDKVYLSSLSGKLYLFDQAKGDLIKMQDAKAITPPTIANNKVYISAIDKSNQNMEVVTVYNASDLSFVKVFSNLTTKNLPQGTSAFNEMNVSGSRLVSYKNKNYNTMGDKLICSNPEDGSVIWSSQITIKEPDLTKPFASSPIIAGNKVIIITQNGNIQIFDPSSGSILKDYPNIASTDTPPLVNDGWIYCSTSKGKFVSIDTKDKTITGWPMWGGNAGHNTVVN